MKQIHSDVNLLFFLLNKESSDSVAFPLAACKRQNNRLTGHAITNPTRFRVDEGNEHQLWIIV